MPFLSFAALPAASRRALARFALTVSMALAAAAPNAVTAQESGRDNVPPPQDTPYPGTIAPVYGSGTAREWGGLVADPRSSTRIQVS